MIHYTRVNTIPSTTIKQLNRDWKRLSDIYQMSEWYDLSAIQEVTRIIGKKWVRYKDDGDDDDENDYDDEENKAIEKL